MFHNVSLVCWTIFKQVDSKYDMKGNRVWGRLFDLQLFVRANIDFTNTGCKTRQPTCSVNSRITAERASGSLRFIFIRTKTQSYIHWKHELICNTTKHLNLMQILSPPKLKSCAQCFFSPPPFPRAQRFLSAAARLLLAAHLIINHATLSEGEQSYTHPSENCWADLVHQHTWHTDASSACGNTAAVPSVGYVTTKLLKNTHP